MDKLQRCQNDLAEARETIEELLSCLHDLLRFGCTGWDPDTLRSEDVAIRVMQVKAKAQDIALQTPQEPREQKDVSAPTPDARRPAGTILKREAADYGASHTSENRVADHATYYRSVIERIANCALAMALTAKSVAEARILVANYIDSEYANYVETANHFYNHGREDERGASNG